MIVEMQTILLKPKSPKQVEQRFEQALPARIKGLELRSVRADVKAAIGTDRGR